MRVKNIFEKFKKIDNITLKYIINNHNKKWVLVYQHLTRKRRK